MHICSAEDPSSHGWYHCGRLLRLLQPGFDQLGTPAAMDQREPALVYHVPDPIPVRPIREREDELFVPLKDVDRCSIHTSRDSSAVHDNTEVRSPGRDGPKKGVRDELVDSSKPRRKGHPRTIVLMALLVGALQRRCQAPPGDHGPVEAGENVSSGRPRRCLFISRVVA